MTSRVVVVGSGLQGMTNASLALSKRLIQCGFHLLYLSPNEIDQRCEREGVLFKRIHQVDYQSFHGSIFQRILSVFQRTRKFDEYFREAGLKEFIQILNDFSPEMVLIDMEMHEHILALYERGIPFTLLSQFFAVWPGENFPPISSMTIPNNKSTGEIETLWNQERIKRKRAFSRHDVQTLGVNRKNALIYKANQIEFNRELWIENVWPTPFVYDLVPVLSMVAKELDFEGSKRANHYYVGPQVDLDRWESDMTGLNDIEQKLHQFAQGKKLIYLTRTSMDDQADQLFGMILEIMQNRNDLVLVCRKENNDDRRYPKNVVALQWVPQMTVLKRADLCIHHAGIHTTHECIITRTPMLVYSGGKHDQNGILARLKSLNLAYISTIEKAEYNDIEIKLNQVLSLHNQHYQEIMNPLEQYHYLDWQELFKKLNETNEADS